jgi:hypothetical protein
MCRITIRLAGLIATILLLISLSSCNGKNDKPEGQSLLKPPYHLEWESIIETNKEIKNLSEIAKNISYIKLSTPKDSPLGQIIQIHNTDNYIFIVDKNGIKMFSKDGSYLRNIGTKGRGPEEYQSLLSILPDEDNNIVIITDANNRRLYFYRFSGEFIKRINLECSPYLITRLTKGVFCISVVPEPQENTTKALFYIVVNLSGDILQEYWSSEKLTTYLTYNISSISKIDPCRFGSLVTPAHGDTTYLLKSDLVREPFIICDYGKYKLPENLWDSIYSRKGVQDYIYNSYIRLFGKNILAQYTFNNKFRGVWCDTQSGSIRKIELKLTDDLDNGPDFNLSSIYENIIFDKIEPFDLLRSDSLLHKIRKDSKLFKLTNEISEFDNTIIRTAELR